VCDHHAVVLSCSHQPGGGRRLSVAQPVGFTRTHEGVFQRNLQS